MQNMTTMIDPAFEQGSILKPHVQNAARFLEARVGNSAVNPHAEWRLTKSTSGSPAIQVHVSDEGVSDEATFAPHEIADYQFTKMRLYDLWFDLLRKRYQLHDARYQELANNSSEE